MGWWALPPRLPCSNPHARAKLSTFRHKLASVPLAATLPEFYLPGGWFRPKSCGLYSLQRQRHIELFGKRGKVIHHIWRQWHTYLDTPRVGLSLRLSQIGRAHV